MPLVKALDNQGNLASHSFSFYLSRGGQGAELALGYKDSSKYSGDTYTTPVTSQTYVSLHHSHLFFSTLDIDLMAKQWEVQSSGREFGDSQILSLISLPFLVGV